MLEPLEVYVLQTSPIGYQLCGFIRGNFLKFMEGLIMTRETMTVHKALSELKLLDDRINKVVTTSIFCAPNKHSNEKIGGVPIAEAKKGMQGSYDKAMDLINRRKALKKAVVLSNAQTMVTIGGTEYTVAEAIEFKNHGIEFETNLSAIMDAQYRKAQAEINKQNGKDLESRADQYVTAIYGQKEGKTNTDDIEKLRKEFLDANSYEMVDPLDIPKKVEEMSSRAAEFMAEVDSALSVSNALTQITIEY